MKKNQLLSIAIIFIGYASFGQTYSTVTGKTPIRLETPKGMSKSKSITKSAIYNAPPNCVIVDFTHNQPHRNGSVNATVSFVQAASTFVSTQQFNSSFDSAKNLATTLKIKGKDLLDLNAKLSNKQSQYQKMQNTINASHATIEHVAQIFGNGRFNGRASYTGNTTVKLLCIDPVLQSPAALNGELTRFVTQYADSLATNIPNNGGVISNTSSTTNNNDIFKSTLGSNIWIIISLILIIILLIIILKRRKKI